MARHRLHWLQLGRVGMSEVEAARGAAGGQTSVLRRRGAVGHDCAPPNRFSEDLI